MNGFSDRQGAMYPYGPRCPYRDTCPMRTECPYCPHQMEGNNRMDPGVYGNMNMAMEYYVKDNMEPIPYPYQNEAPEEFSYDNLYPATTTMPGNTGMENYGNDPVSPQYNQFGYINPEENVLSPWANNNMYGSNVNPLPKRCPCG